ncbi:uncharacterized protein LOC141655421 [Silene latifolia]|uniref:uncharacterized protein LOC141655421 n=1 Tax=Silene latifolia TaxID=37657 RepID=UPI003D777F4D
MPTDLAPIKRNIIDYDAKKRVEQMLHIHEQVKKQIEKSNEVHKAKSKGSRRSKNFEPKDLVWLHLRKEGFPDKRKNKLMPRADGPFEILEKIGPNAYKLNLLGDYEVHELSDDHVEDLRANPFQEGEIEANQGTPSPIEPGFGPSRNLRSKTKPV